MGQVEGKVAFITGGASGIGAACAALLAREGAGVVVSDVDEVRGHAVVAAIIRDGGAALFLHQDVTDEGAWPAAIAAAEQRFGRLDVMVANAGIAVFGPALEMSLADWRRQMAVNVDGVFLSVKYAVPALRRAGGGSIVLMSSVAGLRGSAGLAGYSATKGAVRLLAKSMALECAPDGIRVNSVHPGIILTPIWDKAATPAGGGLNAPLDPQSIARMSVPLGAPAAPDEIANGVLFLASDASRHMTGSELVIDGGMTAGGTRRPS
ncbi:MAG: glucose 1-dehydrogenase [Rhodospirillales bacterium]|nr:glucose 1-dehydrogenase [Rhodospirillales bacterium]MDE2575014.1 glucose 1-dehydrogenase [Rhodospirillales bacterium]